MHNLRESEERLSEMLWGGSSLTRPIRRRRRGVEVTHPGIPGADNRWFPSQGQARNAALLAASRRGPGYTIIWNPAHAPGQHPHYHIVDPEGERVSSHFFYGGSPPRKAPRRGLQGEFQDAPLALPDSPVADRFILAHQSRWCSPGDRHSTTCKNLAAPRTILRVVIHALAVAGTATRSGAEVIVRGWQRRRRQASAHYIVDRDGTITQMVREADVAFHVIGHNGDTIGIEHADICNDPAPYTTQLYERSAELVRDIARRYRLPLNSTTVVGHSSIGGHGDPGPYWDWEYYFRLLGWDGRTASTRPLRLVAMVAQMASRLAGWQSRRRRTIRNSRCATDHDPYGARYWRTQPSARDVPLRFSFDIAEPGIYKVSLWWPKVSGANSATPVEIEVVSVFNPSLQSVTVDQSRNHGRWNDIGRPFIVTLAPATVEVWLHRVSIQRGWILADAVRVLRIG